MTKVFDIMTECIFRLNESDTVQKASLMMKENQIHHLPVYLDKELTGMVSTFDLIGVSYDKLISDVMTKPLITAYEGEELQTIIKTMLDNKIHGIPVIDSKQQLIGIVSSTDIIKHFKA